MATLRQYLLRLCTLLRPAASERELDREVTAHLRLLEEEYARRGMSPVEARRAARLAFGGVDQVKELSRDARGLTALRDLARDTGHAVRRLRRDWRFTVGAVLILALGIGANTAIFSVINAVLIRPQAFEDSHQLVNIYQNVGEARQPGGNSYPAYQDMAAYTDVFAEVSAFTLSPVSYEVDELLRQGFVEYATSSYLSVLGLGPTAGRWFREDEDQPGSGAVAVIGHQTWSSQFDASPSILGQTIRIDGTPVTVVGIAPEGYNNGLTTGIITDFWLSMSTLALVPGALPAAPFARNLAEPLFMVKARLRSDVGVPQAQAAMTTLGTRLAADFPDEDPGRGITVLASDDVRVHPQIDGLLAPTASLLLIVVALVLAIACSNLATLVLIRASSRAKEVSVRLALGATRDQLIRFLLTESVVLSTAGGALGFVVAAWAIRLVALLDLPVVVDLSLDYRVLAFTLLLSMATGLTFGLAPALRATRVTLAPALQDAGATLSLNRRWFSLTNTLVVSQVVASCILLVAASMVVQRLARSQAVDLGFPIGPLAFLETDARYGGHDANAAAALYATLRERLEALPGVEAATLASGPPFGGSVPTRKEVAVNGYTPADGEVADSRWGWAGPGYFETLRIPVLYGRTFTTFDGPDTPPVVVINETMARRYFQTPNAIGRRLRFADSPRQDPATGTEAEVIGVVRDTRWSLNEEPWPLFYRSFGQVQTPTPTVILRTTMDPSALLEPMRSVLRDLDAGLPAITATTMRQHVSESLAAGRAAGGLLAALGALGLGLASLGLYAVVAFGVSRRTLEIGIRTALGAQPGQVTWAMGRQVAQLLAVGLTLGLGLSWLAIQGLGIVAVTLSEAPNLSVSSPSADIFTFSTVALLMATVGLLAAFFPARRAAQADPLAPLRHL